METMDLSNLSNRVIVVKSAITPEEEEYPSYNADDKCSLFKDIATPTGFVLNRGDLRECYVVFPEPGYIPEILKLLDDPKWVGKHMHLTLQRPKKEILPIVAKLLGGQPLDKGKTLNIFLLNRIWKDLRGHQLLLPERKRTLLFLSWLNILNLFKQMN